MGWWAGDLFTVMSTFMGINVMAAQTVCRNVGFLFQAMPMAIMIAASVMVGNYIGKDDVRGAKIYANYSHVLSCIWGGTSALVLVLFQSQIINLFSSSSEVNALVEEAFLLLWVNVFF